MSNLTVKIETPKYENARLWTAKEMKDFLKSKEPLFFDEGVDIYTQRLRQKESTKHKRALKKQAKLALDCEPLNGVLKKKTHETIDIFKNVKDFLTQFNTYNFNLCMDSGLNKFMENRLFGGQYVIKNLKDKKEIALIQQIDKSNTFKFIVYDSKKEPVRWYYIINDYLAKNFNPLKKFEFHKSLYANGEEITKLTPKMLEDLNWLKQSLEKSLDFIRTNQVSQKILKR